MARRRSQAKREAERLFPHHVDVPVPPGGLGRRINDMVAWCQARLREDAWTQHSHRGEPGPDGVPIDYARFYFADQPNAEAFRTRWLKPL
jgi:hypothetical protein